MIRIGNHEVGEAAAPFIIAELSGNHDGSLDKALAIVDAIAESGAHALKLQTYTADTMTIDLAEREFVIENPASLWAGRNLYSLYQEAHTPWDWHAKSVSPGAGARSSGVQHAIDASAGGIPGIARRAGLQNRVLRESRSRSHRLVARTGNR